MAMGELEAFRYMFLCKIQHNYMSALPCPLVIYYIPSKDPHCSSEDQDFVLLKTVENVYSHYTERCLTLTKNSRDIWGMHGAYYWDRQVNNIEVEYHQIG